MYVFEVDDAPFQRGVNRHIMTYYRRLLHSLLCKYEMNNTMSELVGEEGVNIVFINRKRIERFPLSCLSF